MCQSFFNEIDDLLSRVHPLNLNEILEGCTLSRDTHQLQYDAIFNESLTCEPFRTVIRETGCVLGGESSLKATYLHQSYIE